MPLLSSLACLFAPSSKGVAHDQDHDLAQVDAQHLDPLLHGEDREGMVVTIAPTQQGPRTVRQSMERLFVLTMTILGEKGLGGLLLWFWQFLESLATLV